MTVTRSEEVAENTRATLNVSTKSYAITRRSDQDAQGVIVNTVPSLQYPVLRAGIMVYVLQRTEFSTDHLACVCQ